MTRDDPSDAPAARRFARRQGLSSTFASLLFLVIGLGLLGGAGAAYFYVVQRPQTWPTAQAVVVSSRVTNPRGPSQYTPEIVFRYETGGMVHETPTRASWSSSSYDSVRGYVERYPPGTPVSLAINPSDPGPLGSWARSSRSWAS